MILVTKTSDQTRQRGHTLSMCTSVCVCVCMCCHPLHSGRQTCGRTSRGHTGLLHHRFAMLALTFIARRIQPSLSLIDREVAFFVTHELIVLHLFGMIFFDFFYFFYFLLGKIPVRVTALRFELTPQHQKVSRFKPKSPGDRLCLV